MALAGFGILFICGGIQGYQVFVGDLRGAGVLEWPLRVLLVIGGFVIATPGGGIMPLAMAGHLSWIGDPDPDRSGGARADTAPKLAPNQLRAP